MSTTATAADLASTEVVLRVADLDRRCHAFAIDRLAAAGVGVGAAVASGLSPGRGPGVAEVLLVGAVVLLAEAGLALVQGTTGRTPGQVCRGLRTIDPRTGRPIGPGRSLLRTAIVGAAIVPFGLGLAALARTALADPTGLRRGWHDRVCFALVIHARPPSEVAAPDDPEPRPLVNLTALRLVPVRRTPTAPDRVEVPRGAASRELGARPVRGTPGPGWGLVLDTGERVRVESLVLVGRCPEPRPGEEDARLVALTSSDGSVSTTQAHVALAPDGTLVVTDRGSGDGTVLRRRGVARPLTAARPATLLDGDVLHLGDRAITVVALRPSRSHPRTG